MKSIVYLAATAASLAQITNAALWMQIGEVSEESNIYSYNGVDSAEIAATCGKNSLLMGATEIAAFDLEASKDYSSSRRASYDLMPRMTYINIRKSLDAGTVEFLNNMKQDTKMSRVTIGQIKNGTCTSMSFRNVTVQSVNVQSWDSLSENINLDAEIVDITSSRKQANGKFQTSTFSWENPPRVEWNRYDDFGRMSGDMEDQERLVKMPMRMQDVDVEDVAVEDAKYVSTQQESPITWD